MKTTVEISTPLLNQARALAARERTTVRALIEEGLRRVVDEREQAAAFRLRRVTFKGHGLHRIVDRSWEAIRDLAYAERGARSAPPPTISVAFAGLVVHNPLVG